MKSMAQTNKQNQVQGWQIMVSRGSSFGFSLCMGIVENSKNIEND